MYVTIVVCEKTKTMNKEAIRTSIWWLAILSLILGGLVTYIFLNWQDPVRPLLMIIAIVNFISIVFMLSELVESIEYIKTAEEEKNLRLFKEFTTPKMR